MDSLGDLTSSIGKRMKKSFKNCKRNVGEFAQSLSGFANLDTLVKAIQKVRHPEECASRQTNVVHTTVDWSKYPSASYRKGFSSGHNIHFELDPAEADDFPSADEKDDRNDTDREQISNQDGASSNSGSSRAGRGSTLEEQRIYFNTNRYSISPQRNPVSSKSAENIPESKTSFLQVPTDEPKYRAKRSKSLTNENDYRVLHLEHYYKRRGSAPLVSTLRQDLSSPTQKKSAHQSSKQKEKLSPSELFHYRCNEDYIIGGPIQIGCCSKESEDFLYERKSFYRRSSMK